MKIRDQKQGFVLTTFMLLVQYYCSGRDFLTIYQLLLENKKKVHIRYLKMILMTLNISIIKSKSSMYCFFNVHFFQIQNSGIIHSKYDLGS